MTSVVPSSAIGVADPVTRLSASRHDLGVGNRRPSRSATLEDRDAAAAPRASDCDGRPVDRDIVVDRSVLRDEAHAHRHPAVAVPHERAIGAPSDPDSGCTRGSAPSRCRRRSRRRPRGHRRCRPRYRHARPAAYPKLFVHVAISLVDAEAVHRAAFGPASSRPGAPTNRFVPDRSPFPAAMSNPNWSPAHRSHVDVGVVTSVMFHPVPVSLASATRPVDPACTGCTDRQDRLVDPCERCAELVAVLGADDRRERAPAPGVPTSFP